MINHYVLLAIKNSTKNKLNSKYTIQVSSEHLWSHNQHEIKRHLLLGRKAMTILDSILKSRDINHIADKGAYN